MGQGRVEEGSDLHRLGRENKDQPADEVGVGCAGCLSGWCGAEQVPGQACCEYLLIAGLKELTNRLLICTSTPRSVSSPPPSHHPCSG